MPTKPGLSPELLPALIVPDVHRPYHDKRAWRLMMQVGRALMPWAIVIIGDFVDFYAISRYPKDPIRATHLDREIKSGNKGLDELDALGAKEKRFTAGNHEYRWDTYLKEKAAAMYETVGGVEKVLRLEERGWKYTPYRDADSIGHLNMTHDVDAMGRTSVYKALEVFHHSVVTGHTHRLQYVVEGDALGDSKISAQFGHLADISKVDYKNRVKSKKDWALGFGVGYLDPKSGNAYLVPVPIVGYTAMVNGRLYRE